jgi:DNA polymerase I-like protein with 3'-5' exonuclease and polymerase domains
MEKEELGKLAFDRFIAGAKSDTARDYWFTKFKQELGQEVGQSVQVERMYSVEDMQLSFETGRNFQLTGDNNFKELIEQTLEDTLNLDELESKLDAALNRETSESLTEWIETKRNNITSVEWLVEKLEESGIPLMKDELEMIERANGMNQQEIVTAYQEGTKDNFNSPHFGSGLNYFRETYKK